jgi:hypothetical protein
MNRNKVVIKTLRKEKPSLTEVHKGYHILIGFKSMAKDFCVGGYMAKRLMHYYNDEFLFDEDAHPLILEYYIEQQIPIFDLTRGEDYDPSCTKDPLAIIDNSKSILVEINQQKGD